MKERLRRFMLGRYGQDDLNRLLSIMTLALLVISMFVWQTVLYSLVLILLVICIYRMFSKDSARRSQENHAYLRIRGKITHWFTGGKNRIRQRKTHRFFKCPSCRVQLRVPKGKGRISITCSKCHTSFEKKTCWEPDMPTKTFFNLPESKREKLMGAIRAEFSRVSFDEVSINRIIHAAEISRGSFYQYFKDKQDMLGYLLSDYHRIVLDCARDSIQKNDGDLFQMFFDIYDFTCSFVMESANNSFFKNLLSDIRINMDFYTSQAEGSSSDSFIKELSSHVNTDMLDIRDEAELENMLGILLVTLGESLTRTFFDMARCEDVRNGYIARLTLLKRGFLKNKET